MVSSNGTEGADEIFADEILQFELTEEAYEALAALEGYPIMGVAFWDSSLVDDLEDELVDDQDRDVIDLDLYLADNVLLELYGAALYRLPEPTLVVGVVALEKVLVELIDRDGALVEVAESEDGTPALVFGFDDGPFLAVVVGGWLISQWDELPEA